MPKTAHDYNNATTRTEKDALVTNLEGVSAAEAFDTIVNCWVDTLGKRTPKDGAATK